MTQGYDSIPTAGLSDLHRHLDGSLRLSTVNELADALGVSVPDDLYFETGMGLGEALARFAFTLSLLQPQETVARIAGEICEDAAARGVTTLEIRFAPQLHRNQSEADVVDAALEGIAGRAGLILCGLYGEAPEQLERLVEIAKDRSGVVGIDLAGGPQSSNEWQLRDYSKAFQRAKKLGLGRTVHAGEGRPAQEIWDAIEHLGAQRIGHGTSLLDDPALVELICERNITIEACVTSNVHTGAVPRAEDHPIGRWMDLGLSVCICTDNTLFSQVTAPQEYKRVSQLPEMTIEKILQAIQHGHKATFS
jgi:adenosine deaminase